jgi:hypothetical protein
MPAEVGQNVWQTVRQDYYGHPRHVGRIIVAEPMAFVCRVHDGKGYFYIKTRKNNALEHELDCLLQKVPNGPVRVYCRIGHEVNSSGAWTERDYTFVSQGTFEEGRTFSIAVFDRADPAIELLGIACWKLKNLRNGIWRLKPAWLSDIPERERGMYLKTRRGYIGLSPP